MLTSAPHEVYGDPTLVSIANALRPTVLACAEEIEERRRLPEALLDQLHKAQLFRLLLPRSAGGIEANPLTFFSVIESIAMGDASTAWCLGQAGGCAMAAAYLASSVADTIFGSDPCAVVAWGPGPRARAVECRESGKLSGYRITGVWSFVSGGRHATWLGAPCAIFQNDGSPRLEADGRQAERTMLIRSQEVQWTDIWHTIGLRGTASDQFALTDVFVPEEYSITRDFERERREQGPLYRMPILTAYQLAFAAVALGVARGALDDFIDLARNKTPRGLKNPLRDSAVVQLEFAEAEVSVRAARVFLLQSMTAIWQCLTAGHSMTIEQRILMRMASTNAMHRAREAVDFAYNAAGATAIFENHPLERRFRDMHTVTQQLQGRRNHFETVGAWMLGAEANLTFV